MRFWWPTRRGALKRTRSAAGSVARGGLSTSRSLSAESPSAARAASSSAAAASVYFSLEPFRLIDLSPRLASHRSSSSSSSLPSTTCRTAAGATPVPTLRVIGRGEAVAGAAVGAVAGAAVAAAVAVVDGSSCGASSTSQCSCSALAVATEPSSVQGSRCMPLSELRRHDVPACTPLDS